MYIGSLPEIVFNTMLDIGFTTHWEAIAKSKNRKALLKKIIDRVNNAPPYKTELAGLAYTEIGFLLAENITLRQLCAKMPQYRMTFPIIESLSEAMYIAKMEYLTIERDEKEQEKLRMMLSQQANEMELLPGVLTKREQARWKYNMTH